LRQDNGWVNWSGLATLFKELETIAAAKRAQLQGAIDLTLALLRNPDRAAIAHD
jgi:hypothetical protein